MDNRMLERIFIIILLLMNLCLLGVVLSDRAETRRSTARIAEQAAAALEDCGIRIDGDAVAVCQAPPRCGLERSAAAETEIINGLLGQCTPEDMGGNILFYRSERGQALFRGSGEVTLLFAADAVPLRDSEEKTAQRLLRKAGMEAVPAEPAGTEGAAVLTRFYCCRDGYPVFNAELEFDFSGGSLYMISGTRLFDIRTETDDSGLLDSVSALLRFAELVRAGSFSCSRLYGIVPGYLSEVVVSGESSLRPVWRLETDGGTLLLDAESGNVTGEGLPEAPA